MDQGILHAIYPTGSSGWLLSHSIGWPLVFNQYEAGNYLRITGIAVRRDLRGAQMSVPRRDVGIAVDPFLAGAYITVTGEIVATSLANRQALMDQLQQFCSWTKRTDGTHVWYPFGAVNLIPNGSFDNGSSHWATNQVTLSRITSGTQAGAGAGRITSTVSSAGGHEIKPSFLPGGGQAFLPARPGRTYTLSAYVKAGTFTTTQAIMFLRFLDINGNITTQTSTTFALTGSYVRQSVSLLAPAGTVAFDALIQSGGLDSFTSGTYFDVDSVQVEEAATASAFAASNGRQRIIRCVELPDFAGQGPLKTFQFVLYAPDPLAYSIEQSTSPAIAANSSAVIASAGVLAGLEVTYPIVRINGAISDAATRLEVINNSVGLRVRALAGKTIANGAYIEVDMRTGRTTDNTGAIQTGFWDQTISDMWYLTPGGDNVGFNGSSPSGGVGATVTKRDAWAD